ncbi:MFS transporter [Microbacterium rhizophilus]|uniref:MFS transporter n=1 Tax=Microbacterium rhizophilus TaxID=3138934 RepID=UPI0031E9EDB2
MSTSSSRTGSARRKSAPSPLRAPLAIRRIARRRAAAPRTTSPRQALTALGVSIGSFASLQSLLVPVLPVMQGDLGTDAVGITWALTIWLIVAAVATPLLGRAGDLYGKRRIFLIALAAVAAGSIVAALAPNLGVLLGGRALQGIGGAMFPLGFGLVRDVLPAPRVAGGIGILSALMAVGSGIGTVFAGPLATAIGWRGLFILPLAGVTIGAILVLRGVPAADRAVGGRINIPSALLLSAWLVALLLPLSTGSAWGWGSPFVIGLFVLAAALLAAWIAVELRAREPLVDVRMMRLPGVWNANAAAMLVGAAMFGVWAFFARFIQEPVSTGYGFGGTVTTAGLVMLPMLVLMALAGFFTGPLTRILSLRAQLVAGTALIAVPTAGIALLHGSLWMLTAEAALLGLGLGITMAALTNLVIGSVPVHQTGVAAGMNSNLRTIGSAVGTALAAAIITGSAAAPGGEPTEQGYTTGFLVLAALAAGAAVVALLSRPARVEATEVLVETPIGEGELQPAR